MVVQVATLKEIVLAYVCKNVDILFFKQLHKISKYLRENNCDDVTEYFIDNQELNDESSKESGDSSNSAIVVLRTFLKSQGLPKIVWEESNQNNDEVCVGLNVNDIFVKVSDEKKSRARYLAAKLMLRKLYSKYLSDPILNKYNQHEQTYRRAPVYESHSYLTGKSVPEVTINAVDELQGYDFNEEERWEILRNIPEYRIKRSHYMLVLHPNSTELDFSFCPAIFSPTFLRLVLMKANRNDSVETVNLNNCHKTVNGSAVVTAFVEECINLRNLTVNKCKDVASEQVFANLRKYKVDLEKLKISKTYKVNEKGSLHFQKYFTCQLGRRLRVLDISGLSLCENELCYVLGNCKRLVSLNLAETKFDSRCYCPNHEPNGIKFKSSVISSLLELNVSRTVCSSKVLKLLIDNNKHLVRLFKASLQLANALSEPINLQNLEQLRDLDMSFQGSGAYEDFSLYKHDLPISLTYLNASGYCDMDISHLSVVCPYLKFLTLNACIINTRITCRTKENCLGRVESIPHSLQNFSHLRRLELRYSTVNLTELLESSLPLSLEELVVEGDALDDPSLTYIVNSQIPAHSGWTMMHVFNKLSTLHVCNCNQVTDIGIESCNFSDMPSLKNLTIERCSGVRPATLERLQNRLLYTSVFLTCFIDDEKPKFHVPARHVEVIMG